MRSLLFILSILAFIVGFLILGRGDDSGADPQKRPEPIRKKETTERKEKVPGPRKENFQQTIPGTDKTFEMVWWYTDAHFVGFRILLFGE